MSLQILRVLVVEDEPRIRAILEFFLRRRGFHVHAVSNGAEALDALDAEDFDLAVTDFVMPRVSGLQLIKRVRESGRSLPFVLLSATVTAAALKAARRWGAVEVMPKPFSWSEFDEAVDRLLVFQIGSPDHGHAS